MGERKNSEEEWKPDVLFWLCVLLFQQWKTSEDKLYCNVWNGNMWIKGATWTENLDRDFEMINPSLSLPATYVRILRGVGCPLFATLSISILQFLIFENGQSGCGKSDKKRQKVPLIFKNRLSDIGKVARSTSNLPLCVKPLCVKPLFATLTTSTPDFKSCRCPYVNFWTGVTFLKQNGN